MRISVCIPVYPMSDVGVQMLERCLKSIWKQNFKDFEILISDNSKNDEIYELVKDLKVRYLYNPVIGMAVNTNNAIIKAKGEIIKILYQDDYLEDENYLQVVSDNFKVNDKWLVTASHNNPEPHFNDWNKNTLGSPSALTIRNQELLLFNKDLKFYLDLDYYQRMFKKFGNPKILKQVKVGIGIGSHQVTNNLTLEELEDDYLTFIKQS